MSRTLPYCPTHTHYELSRFCTSVLTFDTCVTVMQLTATSTPQWIYNCFLIYIMDLQHYSQLTENNLFNISEPRSIVSSTVLVQF